VSGYNITKITFKLYYFKEKRLAVVFLVLGHCIFLFPQVKTAIPDSAKVRQDTIVKDTILKDTIVKDTILKSVKVAPGAIDKTITYGAKGYRKSDLVSKKVYLVQEAVVNYGDITLKADSIVLDMETKTIFAIGRKDSTGKVIGSPNFTQGNESFDSKEMTYNFNTGKARVINMSTKQEGGYLHSGVTKKFKDGSFDIGKSTYSTCDATPPDYYVAFNRAKVIPGKKIITGPAYMVLEGIPLPLIIPFGFFPIQTKRAASGIIIPKIGESASLGYSLRDGGYYFAISDNVDLAVTGDIYTNGTWTINAASRYLIRYRFSGNFMFSYASNVTGHKGLSDYVKTNNYRIDWRYNQDPKAHPGSTFAASVSMSSSSYDQQNSYIPSEHVNTSRQSSISYSKTWTGTPFDFSTSVNQSQNVETKTVFLDLPKATFNMARIYPLKPENMTGQSKWWQELQFQYSASLDNQINTYDSLLFTSNVFKHMNNGFQHTAPLSIQIRPFRKRPGFTISPSLTYSGVLYTQKYSYRWDPNYYDPSINKVVPKMVQDTLKGLFYGQAFNASVGSAISPQIYGTYQFKNPNSRIQAIRHTIKPSIGFSYTPYLKGLSTNMYQTVQIDTTGRIGKYSVFQNNIFGTPSLSQRSGSITFGLVNTLEAKVFQKNDTTGKPKKVKLIDNFSINTLYSIFADSLKWAPLVMSYRTVLFENINIAASSTFNFYGLDKNGYTHNEFYWTQDHKLLRLTGFSTSLDFDLGRLIKKKTGKPAATATATESTTPLQDQSDDMSKRGLFATDQSSPQPQSTGNLPLDKFGYVNFDMPWSLRVAYSFYYNKPSFATQITQTVVMQGDVSLTKKIKVTYTTGYDLTRKELTMTSIGVWRDLHCWEMSVNWIPIGYMKSWNFTIKVKASVLADLKYNRSKDFHDNY
jgi:lipopolysaccharide assembly outer membrane protein LptD (OstA)